MWPAALIVGMLVMFGAHRYGHRPDSLGGELRHL